MSADLPDDPTRAPAANETTPDLASDAALTRACDALVRGLVGRIEAPAAARALARALAPLRDTTVEVALHLTLDRDIAVLAPGHAEAHLSQLVGRQLADLATAELRRLHLIWLSVKTAITAEVLERFFREVPTWTSDTPRPSALEIPWVATVRSRDLPADSMDMPWHTQLAAARLTVELSDAPLLSRFAGGSVDAARLRLLGDIFAQLNRQRPAASTRAGAPIASAALQSVFRLMVVRPGARPLLADMLRALPFEQRLELARALVVGWESPEETADRSPATRELLASISRSLAPRSALTEVAALQERLFESGAVLREELPAAIQELLARKSETERFLSQTDASLKALEETDAPQSYRRGLRVALRSVPDLLRSKRFEDCGQLAQLIARHRQDGQGFPGRTLVLDESLEALTELGLAGRFSRALNSSRPGARAAMAELLTAMGPVAAPLVIRALQECREPSVLAENESLLGRVATAQWIASQLEPVVFSERLATLLLGALGEVGQLQHASLIGPYFHHTAPAVRVSALEAAHRLGGKHSLPVLVRSLKDPAPVVVEAAISILSRGGYNDPGFVRHLRDLARDEAADARTRAAATRALGRFGNLVIDDEALELTLLAMLPAAEGWRRLWRRGSEPNTPPEVRIAACHALGRLGGDPTLERLSDTSAEPERSVRDAMSEAVAEIQRRRSS